MELLRIVMLACSPVVKCDLFKAFCCNMYCSHLWSNFKNDTLRRLIVGLDITTLFV